MVTAAGVGEYFNTIQSHQYMRTGLILVLIPEIMVSALPSGCKQFFTELDPDAGVDSADDSVSEWNFRLNTVHAVS